MPNTMDKLAELARSKIPGFNKMAQEAKKLPPAAPPVQLPGVEKAAEIGTALAPKVSQEQRQKNGEALSRALRAVQGTGQKVLRFIATDETPADTAKQTTPAEIDAQTKLDQTKYIANQAEIEALRRKIFSGN